jgi:hypothetical protein
VIGLPVQFGMSRLSGRSDPLHPFVSTVASLCFADCFNPYADRCEVHDHIDAPNRRAGALSAIVAQASTTAVDAVWIGRDLGHRGGRRTGLALTDDLHICRHTRRWDVTMDRPTVGAAVAERTAAVVWNMLDRIDARIFLWNVFPLHPHQAGDPFTNRQHNAREREAGEEILANLLALIRPARVIAIGSDAALAARRVVSRVPVVRVRHPSYGGQAAFMSQIAAIHGGMTYRGFGLLA